MLSLSFQVSEDLNSHFKEHLSTQTAKAPLSDTISIKILNQGAWARTYERQPVSLPRELEDFIPEVEEFYKVSLPFNPHYALALGEKITHHFKHLYATQDCARFYSNLT